MKMRRNLPGLLTSSFGKNKKTNMRKVISCSLSPNTETDDVLEAIRVILRPWLWRRGSAIVRIKKWFSTHYGTKHVIFTNSGRSSLFLLLKAFEIGKGDEVIVQTFTCVAVPNSVLWCGATPVYADIDERYNLDPGDLVSRITSSTRAVIVQHTFGYAAQITKIADICRKHKLILIEDCAHSMGVTVNGQQTGTFGDGAIFSFGRDKVISSVFGGAAIVPEKHSNVAKRLEELTAHLEFPARMWVFTQLLHPIAFSVILPLYRLGVGKLILVLLQKLKLLSFPVYKEEKHGSRPPVFPARYPNGLALLLLVQLKKLDRYIRTREEIAKYYEAELSKPGRYTYVIKKPGDVPLRFPVLHEHATQIRLFARKRGILLGNWYHNCIDPNGVDFHAVKFTPENYTETLNVTGDILNLPTLLSPVNAHRVVDVLVRGTQP